MPNFSRAEISNTTEDISGYRTFLKKLAIGQTVTLPLEEGETSRKVMRALNAAAQDSSMRLARVGSPEGSVRFRVVSPEKRTVNISEDARRRRVEKARATRAAKRNTASA